MCVVIVKTQIQLDGRREISEERQYCTSAGQLCDRVDRRELPVERTVTVQPSPRPVITSRHSTMDQSHTSRPRTFLSGDRITLYPRVPRTIKEFDEQRDHRSFVMHDESRRRSRDRESVYEVLPVASSPPRHNAEAPIRYTHYTTAQPQDDLLPEHVLKNEARTSQSYVPPSLRVPHTTTASNRNSRIDSAYAPSEHTKSPSPPRSPNPSRTHGFHHLEAQYLDDRLPGARVTSRSYETDTAVSSLRLRDIEADYERAQEHTDKMDDALRYMSFSDGQVSESRDPYSEQKRAKKAPRIYYRRALTD